MVHKIIIDIHPLLFRLTYFDYLGVTSRNSYLNLGRTLASVARFYTVIPMGSHISPITGPRYPEGSRKLRFPDYVTMAHDGGKVVSLKHRPVFTPRKCSWCSFLLEAESNAGP